MSIECALSIVVPIIKKKGDIRNCSCYRTMQLLDHRIKVVERVLAKRLCRKVTVDEMQFCFIPERGIIDAVHATRRLQEEYYANEKS